MTLQTLQSCATVMGGAPDRRAAPPACAARNAHTRSASRGCHSSEVTPQEDLHARPLVGKATAPREREQWRGRDVSSSAGLQVRHLVVTEQGEREQWRSRGRDVSTSAGTLGRSPSFLTVNLLPEAISDRNENRLSGFWVLCQCVQLGKVCQSSALLP